MTIASRFVDKQRIVTAKIETTYGVDAVPTIAANAIECKDLSESFPFEAIDRDIYKEGMSNDAPLAGKRMAEISLTVELKGSGTRGTAGRLSPLLQAAGFKETVNAGASVIYGPGELQKSCTIYVYDVNVNTGNYLLKKYVGCVGNPDANLKAGVPGYVKLAQKALYTKPVDVADPGTPTYEATIPPVVKSAAVKWGSELLLVLDEIQFALGNEIVERPDINSANSITGYLITGRKPTGSINPEKTLIAEHDFFDELEDKTKCLLQATIGSVSGNIVMVSGASCTIDKISLANRNGIGIFDIPIRFNRTVDSDEIFIKMT